MMLYFERNIKHIPDNSKGLYILFGECGKPIYIGMSKNLKVRLKQHFVVNPPSFFRYVILNNLSSKETKELESFLISSFKPQYNKIL